MESNTNNTSTDTTTFTDTTTLLNVIGQCILSSVPTIVFMSIMTLYDRYKQRQKKLYDVKKEVLSFLKLLKEEKILTENTTDEIKMSVIEPILSDQALKHAILINNSNSIIAFDMLNLTSLVMYWARGVLLYRKNQDMSVAETILSCIHSHILTKSIANSRCNKIFPELSELYGRILDANKKPDEAQQFFTQAQEYASAINSFTEVTAQRLLLWSQHKQITNAIKDLTVKYNRSLHTFKNAGTNSTIQNLITKCSQLVTSYEALQNDTDRYVLSYLDEASKRSVIIPSSDRSHQLKCKQKLLSLELYILILPLLLLKTTSDHSIEETTSDHPIEKTTRDHPIEKTTRDSIKVVMTILKQVVTELKYKKHHSLLDNHTSGKLKDLNNDNTQKNEEYNILLHYEIQDIVYVLKKMREVNLITIHDHKELSKINSMLKENHNKYSNCFSFMFMDNAKFQCMHAQAHDESNKNTTALQNQYSDCLDLSVSNILDLLDVPPLLGDLKIIVN